MDVKNESKLPELNLTKSCKSCAHVTVCQIFRVEVEYLNKEFGEKGLELPFKPEELAKICKFFVHTSAVRLGSLGLSDDSAKEA